MMGTHRPHRRAWLGLAALGALIAALAAMAAHRPAPASATAAAPVQAFHPATVPGEAFLPVLDGVGGATACDVRIQVQNVSAEASKVALVVWGETGACVNDCRGAHKVECSGLLTRGSTWTFLGPQVPTGARSGALYSFSVRNLSELGIDVGFDDVAADYACELLFFGIVGDCADTRRFMRAYSLGQTFEGLPLDIATGGPIAAWVSRDCPADAQSPTERPRYPAQSGADVGGFYQVDAVYRYVVPADPRPSSATDVAHHALHIQNAGIACATVRLIATDACGSDGPCQEFTLAAGERRTVEAAACDVALGGTVEADQPLAIVLDTRVGGPTLALAAASEQRLSYATGGVETRQAGAMELSAPLVYGAYQGWSTAFIVQNLSRETEAEIKLTILDRSGDIITTLKFDRLCPLGSRVISLPESTVLANFVGTARITSQAWWLPNANLPDPPRLMAWAVARTTAQESDGFAYPLFPAGTAIDRTPAANQVGLIGLPGIVKGGEDGTLTSEWALANRVQAHGITELGLYIYDQNGLLDFVCQTLAAQQVDYVNVQTWGYLNNGFWGSIVISATYWDHPILNARGDEVGQAVGLAAVAVARPMRKPGPGRAEPVAGLEPSSAVVGIPFTLVTGAHFVAPYPLCPGGGDPPRKPRPLPTPPPVRWTPMPPDAGPTPTPPGDGSPTPSTPATATIPATPPSPGPTATAAPAWHVFLPLAHLTRDGPDPRPTSPPLTGADAEGEGGPYLPPGQAVYVPVLDTHGAPTLAQPATTTCRREVYAMNVDADPAVALMVLWDDSSACDEPCTGPSRVLCSGLLRPGTRWTFSPERGRSAVVFSVRAGKLSTIGVADPADRTIAAALCDGLSAALRTCARGDAYAAFARAYAGGGVIDGVPLDRAKGGPLAVEVRRRCPLGDDPTAASSASYQGVAERDTGASASAAGAYRFDLPLIYGNAAGYNSFLYLQNASDTCADVEWEIKARDDCLRTSGCGPQRIAPGQMVAVDVAGCTGDDFQGSIIVRSNRPLAIAVDLTGRNGNTLGTYVGKPIDVLGPAGNTAQIAGSRVLYAPLIYHEYQGWDTGIQVENLSSSTAAKVKVLFLDRSGDIITTLIDWVCPLGSQTFFLPVIDTLPGHWVGSARVESQDWFVAGGQPSDPRNLAAVATVIKYADSDRIDTLAFASYNLLAESEAFDWRLGRGQGGLESGVGLIALPFLAAPTASGARTELAVTNLVPKPGFTRYTVALFDANGRVDDVCLDLHEQQVAYLDLARFAHLTNGFAGSALVSATYWNHDVLDDDGAFVRRLVGLAATVVTRDAGTLDHDAPGDELSISTGVPLRGETARRIAPVLAGVGCALVVDDRNSFVYAPGTGAEAGELFVPALRAGPTQLPCDARITVQNLGRVARATDSREAKAVLIAWGPAACPAACAPIVGVVCGGLIKPGGSWAIDTTSLPATAVAGTLFSLVPAAADRLCPLLSAAVGTTVGADCVRSNAFVAAYRNGGSFEGVSLTDAIGPALAAEVVRTCGADADQTIHTSASAPAVSRFDATAGLLQPNGGQSPAFRYSLPQVGDASGHAKAIIHVLNAGDRCATVTLHFSAVHDCPSRACAAVTVAPGAAAVLDAEACRVDGRLVGAGTLESDQPLAVVVDTASPLSLSSYAATTTGDAATVAFAPLTYSEYQGWSTAIHIQNMDPSRAGRVKVVFLDRSGDIIETLTDWLCPSGSAVLRLDAVHDLPGRWVGAVRVESLDTPSATAAGPRVAPVEFLAVAELRRAADANDAAAPSDAAAYRLLTPGLANFADTRGLWPAGDRNGWLTGDGGLLALPSLTKGTKAVPGGSEIAIANLVAAPGFTDFTLYIFDANGLVDAVCQKLNAHQVEYIDLATWGSIQPGFHGSAVISAVYWNHPLRDAAGREVCNVVGLGAVLVQRIHAASDTPVPGDALTATEAWPIPWAEFGGLGPPAMQCPGSGRDPAPTSVPNVGVSHGRAP